MSGNKKNSQNDIVATPEDQPEILSEERLDDAQGGRGLASVNTYGLDLRRSVSSSSIAGANSATIYGGDSIDDIFDASADPSRKPGIYGGKL